MYNEVRRPHGYCLTTPAAAQARMFDPAWHTEAARKQRRLGAGTGDWQPQRFKLSCERLRSKVERHLPSSSLAGSSSTVSKPLCCALPVRRLPRRGLRWQGLRHRFKPKPLRCAASHRRKGVQAPSSYADIKSLYCTCSNSRQDFEQLHGNAAVSWLVSHIC